PPISTAQRQVRQVVRPSVLLRNDGCMMCPRLQLLKESLRDDGATPRRGASLRAPRVGWQNTWILGGDRDRRPAGVAKPHPAAGIGGKSIARACGSRQNEI